MSVDRSWILVALACAVASLVGARDALATPPCSATTVTSNTTVSSNTGCNYLWQAGNLTVDTDIDDSNLAGTLSLGLITTDMLSSGTLTLNAGASVVTSTSPSAAGAVYVQNADSVTRILNNGTITGQTAAIYLNGTGMVGTLENNGTIHGAGNFGIDSQGVITTLTNLGMITGATTSIRNLGTIGTLVNSQQGLTYRGSAPAAYFTYVASPSSFGTLIVKNSANFAIGAMTYGVATGSTLAGSTTYEDVIQNGDPDHGCTPAPGGHLASCDRVISHIAFTSFDSTDTKTGSYVSGNRTYTFSLVFDGENFDLVTDELARASVVESALAMGNSPGFAAAAVIDQSDELLALFEEQITEQEVNEALTQTLPLLTGNSATAAQGAMTGISRVVQARTEGNHGLSSGDEAYGDAYVWLKPFASWGDQHDRGGVAGFKAETVGLVAGADRAFSDTTRLGAALAYARVNIDGRSAVAPQDADLHVYQLIAYGSYAVDPRTDINVQVDLGLNSTDGSRRIAFTGSAAASDYDSLTTHVGAGLGRSFAIGEQTTITPSMRADYTWVRDESYRETGAGLLDLNVSDRVSDAFVTSFDAKLTHALSEQASIVASLGVGYDALDERAEVRSAFAGAPGASFVTKGMHSDPWMSRGGLAALYTTPAGLELSAHLDSEHDRKFFNHTASLRLRWSF